MKRLILLLIISFSTIYPQGIPQTINYQGVLKDPFGNVVPNGNYDLTFTLYDAETGGTNLWSESKSLNITNGIINTALGSVTVIPQNIFTSALWLGIKVGSSTEFTPRIPLTSVPYSYYTMNVLDGSITASKIATGSVVKSLNGIKDNVNLVAGSNITITPSGNNITISSTGGSTGIGGSGTTNYLPLFTGSTTLGNSVIYQSGTKIGINNNSPDYSLTVNSDGTAGLGLKIARNGGLLGLSLVDNAQPTGLRGWGFEAYNQKLTIKATGDNGHSTIKDLMTFQRDGFIGIGTTTPVSPFEVKSQSLYAGRFTSDLANYNTMVVYAAYTGTGNYDAIGVYGKSAPSDHYGIGGYFIGGYRGVHGQVTPTGSSLYYGVYGNVNGGSGTNYGFFGGALGSGTNYGIYCTASGGSTNYAGYFNGNARVTGTLSKGAGSFMIDHPLDPANKYLYHSFVESPDMMNIYNGNVVTDAAGYATVTLPDWFEALNKDFRYQLTVIGDFAQAIIAQEVQNNQFAIRTDKPNVKVSWQVTGIRHDKFAEKNRIPVEENKKGDEIGKYIHPDAFGLSEELGIDYSKNKIEKDRK